VAGIATSTGTPGRTPVGTGVRRAWMVGGSLFAVAALAMGTTQAVSVLAHEESTFTTEVDAADVRAIEVRNDAGPVYVVGTGGDTVRITGRVSHGLRATGHSERVEGDTLVLDASCPLFVSTFCRVTYNLEVPAGLSVRVRSEGRLTISDVDGDVDAATDNGSVRATRIGGDVVLSSDNGSVVATDLRGASAQADSDNGRVELGFVQPPRDVTATSDNGSVEVVVPEGVDYQVDASTDNGALATLVATAPSSDHDVTARSDNGDVTVRYPSSG